jgi:Zn-dependent alcohol dehydrogenase
MSSVTTTAAVLWALGKPFETTEVELAAPGPHEVRVRIEASGVCHSDWNAATGTSLTPMPAVLGHEGCGTVEMVGPEVTAVRTGDLVVLCWLPACGRCRACVTGRPTLCEVATSQMSAGSLPGGGFRISRDGERIHHYSYLSTFARQAVVHEQCCIRLPAGTDPEVAALVGCAVMTGIGAVVNRAKVAPGSSVVVFGAGGVGLSAVMGAALAGAETIIAVDLSAQRRALALELGANHVFDGADPGVAEAVRQLTSGGVDYSFEAAGHPRLVETAFSVTRPGGTIVAVGVPPDGSVVSVPGPELTRSEKVLTGTLYGSARPQVDMPMILRLHAEGRLPLGRLVGRRYRLDQVNEAFADMQAGGSARGVIKPWGDAER